MDLGLKCKYVFIVLQKLCTLAPLESQIWSHGLFIWFCFGIFDLVLSFSVNPSRFTKSYILIFNKRKREEVE